MSCLLLGIVFLRFCFRPWSILKENENPDWLLLISINLYTPRYKKKHLAASRLPWILMRGCRTKIENDTVKIFDYFDYFDYWVSCRTNISPTMKFPWWMTRIVLTNQNTYKKIRKEIKQKFKWHLRFNVGPQKMLIEFKQIYSFCDLSWFL